ncbi:site-specific DNA-methyltransferase [Virgibacillus soli]|uniref:Site-specific DNA-methyltransferase n=1 Tax=Paracerasibacillus soli TaxID=480284 RepID=A0ABU5CUT3_9BACI|nr:site-specific DNA-methyltransferase [Virgibacillus soli]MDY0410133.1 site-specific DNA-methyltransferase [Virgibacillus soli]
MPTLEWIGKDKVVNHHLDVPYRVLDFKYSYNENGVSDQESSSDNKIIKGDNLEALKALLPQYEGRINCIYIDPPYNTGNEKWVYNDNVNDPKIKKWLGEVVGKEGEDLSRHDKWLSMMYPRLKLLHKLLADDGAIFISINYIEQAYLKLICNEIFGANNFISEVAIVNNPKGRSDDNYIATAHESLLIYRKSKNLELGGFLPEEKVTKRYNKLEEESGRKYREIDLRKTGDEDLREDRPDMFYPFFYNEVTKDLKVGSLDEKLPDGYMSILPMKSKTVEGRWRWGVDTAKRDIKKLLARYMPVKKQWSVFEKDYLDEKELVKPTSAWTFKDVNSERGTEMFTKHLGFKKSDFPNPKPVGTIERVLQIATDKNSIVLDSYAGSGTTAQAVLNLNNKDKGNRKFILVELEDYAETVTTERVNRVINGHKDFQGVGGNYNFYHLGQPLLLENKFINENIDIQKIREYIFFTETKKQITVVDDKDNKYLLGEHNDSLYYFYYEKDKTTSLSYDFLSKINKSAERYIIYADVNLLSKSECDKLNIVFKKIPRDIARL